MAKHPMQKIKMDGETPRFVDNKIVRFLLDAGPYDMNSLAMMPFSKADRSQFAQLIGYSVCGYGELSYATRVEKADRIAAELRELKEGDAAF